MSMQGSWSPTPPTETSPYRLYWWVAVWSESDAEWQFRIVGPNLVKEITHGWLWWSVPLEHPPKPPEPEAILD